MTTHHVRKHPLAGIRITQLSQGIVIISFDSFEEHVVDQWAEFITSSSRYLGSQHRVLYDFRAAGAPSQYALERVGPVLASIVIPPDTRTAHLYQSERDMRYTQLIRRQMPSKVGAVRAFFRLEQALEWLLE